MTVDLVRGATGQWAGSLSIPLANALDLPLSKIGVEEGGIRFTAADLPNGPIFDGKFSADGAALSGTVNNGAVPIKFEWKRTGDAQVRSIPKSSVLTKEFEGKWAGAILAGDSQLRLGLELTRAADGTATGRLISIDLESQVIPITLVTIRESMLQLEIRGVNGEFVGVLGATGEIAGTWTQGPNRLPLTFQRVAEAKQP